MVCKAAVAAGVAVALLVSDTACAAKPSTTTVTYHVTGPSADGTVQFEYVDSDGQRAQDSTAAATIDWTMQATTNVETVFVTAQVVPPATDPKLTLTCTISVGGKVLVTKSGWTNCEANVEVNK